MLLEGRHLTAEVGDAMTTADLMIVVHMAVEVVVVVVVVVAAAGIGLAVDIRCVFAKLKE